MTGEQDGRRTSRTGSGIDRTCAHCGQEKVRVYIWHDGAVSKDCPCGWKHDIPASDTDIPRLEPGEIEL